MREFICTPLDLSEPQAFFASGKVETIVRCKDCAYFDTRKCKSQWPFRFDGFCAWGERRVDA